jgi:hypothetical protein
MSVNLNTWATDLTKREGKKVNLSVAQIKEVMSLMLQDLKGMSLDDLTKLLGKTSKKTIKKVKK